VTVPANVSAVREPPVAPHRATPLWWRGYLYWAYQYKKTWRSSITTSFLFPVLYLLGMGLGLGSLVDRHAHTVGGVSYLDYIAPGLLAATAMQIGATDAMYPVMAAIKWFRTYFAMLSTPLRVDDVLIGHLAWIATRVALVSAAYLAVIAAFGVVASPWAILALPAAVLTGVAFAAPLAAFAATQEGDLPFSTIQRFALIPLFLFSGTFFPVSQLPGWLQPVAYATPLYHGVELCRGLVLGTLPLGSGLGDVAYLVALTAVGLLVGRRTYAARLVV
jgi:lipooligosaccharide transport system permease protein